MSTEERAFYVVMLRSEFEYANKYEALSYARGAAARHAASEPGARVYVLKAVAVCKAGAPPVVEEELE